MKKTAAKLMEYGFVNQMSDLYILPKPNHYELSFRYHHDIQIYDTLPYKTAEQLILYFKYLAGMDIAEKRKVQMGGTTLKIKKQSYRIRLSVVGDFLNRETLVIRFLYPLSSTQSLQFVDSTQIDRLKCSISRNGLFLFSGPTGSGKSTTMHLLMQHLIHYENKHIITIEDPVEIEDSECIQFQVNEKIGLTYQELIKVCLRHRPDCLMIGEIRDAQTAQMAIRASLTGHLVFSTIHAKNRKGVVSRLTELGIPLEEIKQSVKGIVYQEMIPLKGERKYGVLYDMPQTEGVDEWEKSLQKAFYEKKITKKTLEMYKN